jgi:hypothetical protein
MATQESARESFDMKKGVTMSQAYQTDATRRSGNFATRSIFLRAGGIFCLTSTVFFHFRNGN